MHGPKGTMSLMDQQVRLLSDPNFRQKTEEDKQKELEAELIAAVSERKPMMAAKELADGHVYTEALKTIWRPPRHNAAEPAPCPKPSGAAATAAAAAPLTPRSELIRFSPGPRVPNSQENFHAGKQNHQRSTQK